MRFGRGPPGTPGTPRNPHENWRGTPAEPPRNPRNPRGTPSRSRKKESASGHWNAAERTLRRPCGAWLTSCPQGAALLNRHPWMVRAALVRREPFLGQNYFGALAYLPVRQNKNVTFCFSCVSSHTFAAVCGGDSAAPLPSTLPPPLSASLVTAMACPSLTAASGAAAHRL